MIFFIWHNCISEDMMEMVRMLNLFFRIMSSLSGGSSSWSKELCWCCNHHWLTVLIQILFNKMYYVVASDYKYCYYGNDMMDYFYIIIQTAIIIVQWLLQYTLTIMHHVSCSNYLRGKRSFDANTIGLLQSICRLSSFIWAVVH